MKYKLFIITFFILWGCQETNKKSSVIKKPKTLTANIKTQKTFDDTTKIEADKEKESNKTINISKFENTYSTRNYFYNKVNKEKQFFNLKPNKDTIIFGKEGTGIFLPKEILNGQKIRVELSEYYNPYNIILSKLTTTSNNKLLETAGMINLNIFIDGKKIILKDEITIFFPIKNNRKESPKLFYGNKKNDKLINWELDSNNFITYKMVAISYIGGGYQIEHSIGVSQNPNKEERDFPIYSYFSSFKLSPEECLIIANKNRNNNDTGFIKINKGLMLKRSLSNSFIINFKLTKDGQLQNIVIKKSINKQIDTKIINYFKAFLIDEKENINWEEATKKDYLFFKFKPVLNKRKFRNEFKKKYQNFYKKNISNINDAELKYYIFNATKLGLINCDFFWENKNERINLIVKIKPNQNTNLMLAFKNTKSFIRPTIIGGKYIFKNIPANLKASIIGLKRENNKSLFVKKDIITGKQQISNFKFEEKTLSQLEIILNSI